MAVDDGEKCIAGKIVDKFSAHGIPRLFVFLTDDGSEPAHLAALIPFAVLYHGERGAGAISR